jgi:hypothetical protein
MGKQSNVSTHSIPEIAFPEVCRILITHGIKQAFLSITKLTRCRFPRSAAEKERRIESGKFCEK